VRDLHASFNKSDLINGFYVWRKSTVNAENFALDNGSDTKVVKYFCTVFPRVGIAVFSNGLIIEPIYSSDLSCFVVSSQESDMSRVFEL
jgi:hypothetical protein